MCLHCNKQQIKIAETDIECYKVIEERKSTIDYNYDLILNIALKKYNISIFGFKYVTPYYRFPVIFNKEFYDDEFYESVLDGFDDGEYDDRFVFGHHMFHSFVTKPDSFLLIAEPVFAKCIIPKGSRYIEGVDDCGKKCYGSEKIIYKEIID